MKKFLRLFVVSLAFMVMCILPMACNNDKTPTQPETHTVTFVDEWGYNDDVEVEVIDGETVEAPDFAKPNNDENYIIVGWSYDDDDDDTTPRVWFDIDEPITEDVVLYAWWNDPYAR